jgi:glucose/arabinose dehydrogenase
MPCARSHFADARHPAVARRDLAGKVRVEVLQNQLAHPWALAFLPDDQGMLMTLRGGELKRWPVGAISGVPQVWANGQGAYWTWRWPRISRSRAGSG